MNSFSSPRGHFSALLAIQLGFFCPNVSGVDHSSLRTWNYITQKCCATEERRLSNENTERERFRGGAPGVFLADILIALKLVELDGRSERAVLRGLLQAERAQGASGSA